ncbi:MAG: sulfatase [Acidobacteriota bacterium]
MTPRSKRAGRFFFILSLIIIVSFLLTLILFPFSTILLNRYIKFGYFFTILHTFFEIYFPVLLITAISVSLAWFFTGVLSLLKNGGLKSPFIYKITLVPGFIITLLAAIRIELLVITRTEIFNGPGILLALIALSGLIIILSLIIYYFGEKKNRPLRFFTPILIFLILTAIYFNISNKRVEGPNVVFIIVDTLRSDFTSTGNTKKNTTEYLKDSLLPDSLYFKRAYSNAPWTLPSIASMVTSKYPSKLGIRNLVSRLGERDFTLAELMREKGYKTCSIISHILLKKVYGFSQGFDIFNERNISDKFGNHYSISSPGISEDAVEFIKKNKKNKFFLFLHYFDPHYIYIDHEKKGDYSGSFTSKDIAFLRKQISENNYSENDINYLTDCYDTEIRFTDFHIGKVIEELKKTGLYENTVIVFTSDHGEEFVERGWLGHSTSLHSEQINVPLLIKPSKRSEIKSFIEDEIPVSNLDIIPTLTSLMGFKNLPGAAGADLLSNDIKDNYVFSEVSQKEFGDHIEHISVIWKEWKLIRDLNNKVFLLYNLKEDPSEKKNIFGKFPGIEAKLKVKIAKWLRGNRKTGKIKRREKPLSDSEREKLKTLGYIN